MQTRIHGKVGDFAGSPNELSHPQLFRPLNGVPVVPPASWASDTPQSNISSLTVLLIGTTQIDVTYVYTPAVISTQEGQFPSLPSVGGLALAWPAQVSPTILVESLTSASAITATVSSASYAPTTGVVTITLKMSPSNQAGWNTALLTYGTPGAESPTFALYYWGSTSMKANLIATNTSSPAMEMFEPDSGDTGSVIVISPPLPSMQFNLSSPVWWFKQPLTAPVTSITPITEIWSPLM